MSERDAPDTPPESGPIGADEGSGCCARRGSTCRRPSSVSARSSSCCRDGARTVLGARPG